jgi:ubiquinone biosynthesis protein
LCFHDFGIVGQLTPPMRRKLAMFVLALSNQDENWLVDAAADLGVLSPAVDRGFARERIGAIVAEYAGRPIGDWSIGDVLIRIMRLGRGAGLALPTNLAILARAALLVERVLRGLDRELTVVSAVADTNPEFLSTVFKVRPDSVALSRLKSEAATTVQSLPVLIAEWLHDARREGGGIPVALRMEALDAASRRAVRGIDRLALALVALGLYVAASLLMQHSVGPRILGGWPLFAVIGYVLALWFTLRIVRSIGGAERRAVGSGGSS